MAMGVMFYRWVWACLLASVAGLGEPGRNVEEVSKEYTRRKREIVRGLRLLPSRALVAFPGHEPLSPQDTIRRLNSHRHLSSDELTHLNKVVTALIRGEEKLNDNAREERDTGKSAAAILSRSFRKLAEREPLGSYRTQLEQRAAEFEQLHSALGSLSSLEQVALALARVEEGQELLKDTIKQHAERIFRAVEAGAGKTLTH